MWSLYKRSHRVGYITCFIGSGLSIILSLAMIKLAELQGQLTPLLLLLFVIVLAASVWIAMASSVRRLHDIGWSGWWLFVCVIPPAGLYQLLVLMSKPSQPVVNAYGPPATVRWTSTELKRLRSASY